VIRGAVSSFAPSADGDDVAALAARPAQENALAGSDDEPVVRTELLLFTPGSMVPEKRIGLRLRPSIFMPRWASRDAS
jgi:hypothetical protein